MVQGESFLEGISLRDESYDGTGSKWDRKVDPTSVPVDTPSSVTIFHKESESESFQLSPRTEDGGKAHSWLTGGLGQLTDKIEGASSFTMDLGYGLGKPFFTISLSYIPSLQLMAGCFLLSPSPSTSPHGRQSLRFHSLLMLKSKL
jgi:hypothetical protein